MHDKISSPSNSLIKHAKSLSRKKDRWKEKAFFIEGIKAVEECLNYNGDIEYILYTEHLLSLDGGEKLLKLIKMRNIKNYCITEKLYREITDTETPQGIFAAVKFNMQNLEDVLLEANNFIILLDRVQDPGNLGTIIRTADALGANGIIVTNGCVDVYNPKTVRSTMGSIFHTPLLYFNDIEEAINKLKSRDIKIMSTSLDTDKYCYDIDFRGSFALIIGNEASGVSEQVINLSDFKLKIPMAGKAESLNAAIASAIVMYEASRQRQNF